MGKFNSLTPDVLENIEPVYMELVRVLYGNHMLQIKKLKI